MNYDQRRDQITNLVCDLWEDTGGHMGDDAFKTVQDAVNNCYFDGISDGDWLAAAVKRLGIDARLQGQLRRGFVNTSQF